MNIDSSNQKIDVDIYFDLPYCLYLKDGTYTVIVDDIKADVTLQKKYQQSVDARLEINFWMKDQIDDHSFYSVKNIDTNEETIVEGSELKKDKAAYQILEVDNRKDPPLMLFAAPTYYNCELKGDKRGFVRYTCVNMTLKQVKRLEENMDYVWDALKVINRLIEVYRYVAKEPHIEKITINDLYSISISTTFAFPPQWKVVPLLDDLSEDQHLEIYKMSKNNEAAPLDSLLLLDAKIFLEKGDYRRVIVECVIAVEPLIEGFLDAKLKEAGISSDYRDDFFKAVTLSPQVKGLLKLFIQKEELDHQLINDLAKTIKLRNDIVHESFKLKDGITQKLIDVSMEDGEKAINCTEKIVSFIRNKFEERSKIS